MLHLCTYFDHRYLVYGLALYRSLVRRAEQPFTLHVLCLDDAVVDCLQGLSLAGVHLIRLSDLEQAYPALLTARQNRSLLEYYFTLTPALPCYLFEKSPEIELLAYVDADLYFYSRLDPLYQELGTGSVLLIPHRVPDAQICQGTYNVGLLLFRNDEGGRESLNFWRERCIEWCYDRREDGKCADQGYLEDWPSRFPHVVVSQHKGAGLAPWNVARYTLSWKGGAVFVDSDPLIFYHFGDLRMVRLNLFANDLALYDTRLTRTLKQLLYVPYMRELRLVALETGVVPGPRLKSGHGNTCAEWLSLTLYGARLVMVGPLVIQLHFGPVGRLLAKLRQRVLRHAPQEAK